MGPPLPAPCGSVRLTTTARRCSPSRATRSSSTPTAPVSGRPGPAPATLRWRPFHSLWRRRSAAPFQRAGLHRVPERAAFRAGAAVFALQPIVPFRLSVGVVDQGQWRVEAQPLLLTLHDGAVLLQKCPY